MRILVMMAAVAVLASTAADAQVPARGPAQDAINNLLDPIRWAPIETFDVAGVRLGMTPQEARAALVSKGFTPRATDPSQPSWAALVSERVADRRGGRSDASTVARFTMAEGPQGEHIEVWYAPTRAGARVANVTYTIPSNRMEAQAFLDSVTSKYGKPSFTERTKRFYCSRGRDSRASCWRLGDTANRPGLLASSEFAVRTIDLTEGSDTADARKQQLAGEVEAAAPKDAKASF
ncbi:hypothetical protein [Sphingomonas sp. PvP018]|uniref:hypothetical protein n=1 Tax=Sphingomonas sp. PvP018 TaxID=2817852 RepID=UPI001AE5703F|nr:hypothetical protein [Sphingomonas sp. PvP018]MBP2513820.1 hypothetical protein [Sphingomonas sp. PvP018]